MDLPDIEELARRWTTDDPGRVMGPGHPVGDFLGAPEWRVLERASGRLRVRAGLPSAVRNPLGELFGGFTPTYVDLLALHAFHTARGEGEPRRWLRTASLRVEYFAPIRGPEFEMIGSVLHRSGRTAHVEVRFHDAGGRLCALAQATLVEARD